MHVHCLSVLNLKSCLCLRHRRRAIEYLFLFYLNVNIQFFFFFTCATKSCSPFWKIQDSLFSPFISCPTSYLCSERESFILFLYNILLVFPQFPFIYSPQAFLPSLPVLFSLSQTQKADITSCLQKSKHSHNRGASGWREISHRVSWRNWHKIYLSLLKGTYFSVFTAPGSIIFCSYWIRMRRKVKSTFELLSLLKRLW